MSSRFARAVLASFLLSAVAGCSSSGPPKEDDTTKDLGYIARAYGLIVQGHERPPRDLEEIKQFLADLHAADQNPAPEEVLTSSRDGQPYVIILGANLGGEVSRDILAYEKTGAEGKRYVLLMSRDVVLMTDEEFNQSTFARGHRPTKG